jgi:hypothetical protein
MQKGFSLRLWLFALCFSMVLFLIPSQRTALLFGLGLSFLGQFWIYSVFFLWKKASVPQSIRNRMFFAVAVKWIITIFGFSLCFLSFPSVDPFGILIGYVLAQLFFLRLFPFCMKGN